jgi:hypothetical protein
VNGADVELMILDLNSLDSVRSFASKLHSAVDKVFLQHIFLYSVHISKTFSFTSKNAFERYENIPRGNKMGC